MLRIEREMAREMARELEDIVDLLNELEVAEVIENINPCHALTKKGVRCKNYASDGPRWFRGKKQMFCHRHRTYMKDLRMTHLRRVFRAAVNMIIVHKRYINDYYMPGGKGAKMAAIEFKARA